LRNWRPSKRDEDWRQALVNLGYCGYLEVEATGLLGYWWELGSAIGGLGTMEGSKNKSRKCGACPIGDPAHHEWAMMGLVDK
jgi:hypothetical protein